MQALNRETAQKSHNLPLKIMQFGGGNFLRAFVDWMVDILNEETDFNGGIAVIKPTAGGDYAELKSQDGLFTVVLDGVKEGRQINEKHLVTSVQKVVNCYTEWSNYLELAENPDIRFIVSNTTEAGIQFNSKNKKEDTPPGEFPAKLTLWLLHRFEYFDGNTDKGCIFLPC
ncbi:MAG: tagaturonate reductase, partial [Pricia sp.]